VSRSSQEPVGPTSFSDYLRRAREGKSLSLADISRTTKVPESSLERLEAGKFDELPAEVFIRGFLRSFARCVALDPDEVLRRYVEHRRASGNWAEGAGRGKVATAAEPVAPPRPSTKEGDSPECTVHPADGAPRPADQAAGAEREAAAPMRSRLQATGLFIRNRLFLDDEPPASRRGAVTLAVIILVILATITMSYLLRKPTYNGDGLTSFEPAHGKLPAATSPRPAPPIG
jgi:hypothetical protein